MADDGKDSVEERAREQGWADKDEWHGDPEKWVDAEAFVKRGEEILPLLQKEVRTLRMSQKMLEKAFSKEVETAKQRGYDKAKAEYDAKIDEIRKQKMEAFNEGDTEAFIAAEEKERKTKPPEAPGGETAPSVDKDFIAWQVENPWYAADITDLDENSDLDMTVYANGIAATIDADMQKTGKKLSGAEFYKLVESKVKKAFPHKFKNPKREEEQRTNRSGHSGASDGSSGGEKTWEDLPKDAKEAFKRTQQRLKKFKIEYTKDEYVKEYFND